MRVLIVAPNVAGIDAIVEVRRIQSWHDVAILHGTVTPEDLYRTLQEKTYDSVYFASHGGPEGIELSNGIIMPAEDIAQAARQREVTGLFFAACQTGKIASYCVNHGLRWAISSEIDLPNEAAWRLAAAFYSYQRNGNSKDFVGAYLLADSGDGDYALHISPRYVRDLQRTAVVAASLPHITRPITRQEALLWAMGLLVASTALAAGVINLAGGW